MTPPTPPPLTCAKCGYQWHPKVKDRDPKTIKECPACKSRKWKDFWMRTQDERERQVGRKA